MALVITCATWMVAVFSLVHGFQFPVPIRSTFVRNNHGSIAKNMLLSSPQLYQAPRNTLSALSSSASDFEAELDINLLKEVDAIFDSIDTDNDGIISSDELRSHLMDTMGYSIESAGYLFAALDRDINGNISRTEMMTAFSKYETVALYMTLGLGGSELTDGAFSDRVKDICRRYEMSADPESRNKLVLDDLADLVFDIIDDDKSGEIDSKELRDHFEQAAKKGCEDPGKSVQSIFDVLDLNLDGVISREEMREGFKKYDHKTLSEALGLRVYHTKEA
eukprot:CAMPEP_0172505870 /NCGR_PEP_ID=MMETSP1066-20121228/189513_1 /TAXON_ID=671091 /ORGANISM="Coscinodiscus wailesii, Strain CCMP2513" /LENGTH=277 /DNA_ID=CAMNT_0013282627 /DNA_START=68 /DNA_END=901 /DNA_ORIENTATION=-